ncbi:MAG: nucleoid occlusion factor SlmA [Gammaproteobacteria bacterium]|nr:nucleoid occlusion factor SlmA [Gammaproteobacteria bacterium]MCF6230583.1 nucleoid occlusion factor SlmA [Gammaproteobacteria bacterium]
MSNGTRKQQILEALAQQLENNLGARITTAALAKEVGVSEAALYRHFPSKAKIFEGLIEFAEEAIFSRLSRILEEIQNPVLRCEKIITVLLAFSARNPGITRILIGDAIIGENERLHKRTNQFFERLETQLKQVLREGELSGELPGGRGLPSTANLLVSLAEGRMHQFVRSRFQRLPTEQWNNQWPMLVKGLFE